MGSLTHAWFRSSNALDVQQHVGWKQAQLAYLLMDQELQTMGTTLTADGWSHLQALHKLLSDSKTLTLRKVSILCAWPNVRHWIVRMGKSWLPFLAPTLLHSLWYQAQVSWRLPLLLMEASLDLGFLPCGPRWAYCVCIRIVMYAYYMWVLCALVAYVDSLTWEWFLCSCIFNITHTK